MELRNAHPTEQAVVRALWEQGFGNEEPYTGWYFQQIYRPERTLLLFDEGELRAALQTAPYTLMLNCCQEQAAYLVGVVTDQRHRRQGYGHTLMREALRRLREQGCRLAMLYTDVPDFYAPLGFVHCYQLRSLLIPAQDRPLSFGWEQAAPDSRTIARLDAVYRRMTKPWNGYIVRTPENWRHYLEEQRCDQGAIWLTDDAYVLWYEAEGQPEIRELGFADETALNAALEAAGALAAARGLAQARWLAPLAAPLPRQANETLRPYVMACRLDCPELSGAALADATLALFRDREPLNWINEMT